jgi:transmembrane sensor
VLIYIAANKGAIHLEPSSRIEYLLDQFIAGTCTLTERAELMSMLRKDQEAVKVSAYIDRRLQQIDAGDIADKTLDPGRAVMVFDRVRQQIFPIPAGEISQHQVHFIRRVWFRYAVVLLLIVGGAWLYQHNKPDKRMAGVESRGQAQIVPGRSMAILTLEDGRRITLGASSSDPIPRQGNTRIIRPDSGQLVYQTSGMSSMLSYNTVTTPKGGQYQVILPDHSKVWLNSASSITFPTAFGNVRKVNIMGEAYFEITPDPNKPFTVSVDSLEVKVLGTRFNINAYAQEHNTRTTLLAGSVSITKREIKLILQPGQQATASPGDKLSLNRIVDTSQAVAWKNGLFNFNRIPLKQAMRQISQWYDVEVFYEQGVPEITFGGEFERGLNIEKVLKFLNKTGAHFRLQERTIIVSP